MPFKGCTNTIVVPTKGEDNCSYAAYTPKSDDGDVDDTDTFDAFSYYSSDLIRFKTLLLSSGEGGSNDEDDLSAMTAVNNALRSAGLNTLRSSSNQVNDDDAASKRRRGNNSLPIEQQQQQQRKTRLSWELHPSLLLHELYDWPGEDVQVIPDDESDQKNEHEV
jgi:hypothetical protein